MPLYWTLVQQKRVWLQVQIGNRQELKSECEARTPKTTATVRTANALARWVQTFAECFRIPDKAREKAQGVP
jgi:hypothetical protein